MQRISFKCNRSFLVLFVLISFGYSRVIISSSPDGINETSASSVIDIEKSDNDTNEAIQIQNFSYLTSPENNDSGINYHNEHFTQKLLSNYGSEFLVEDKEAIDNNVFEQNTNENNIEHEATNNTNNERLRKMTVLEWQNNFNDFNDLQTIMYDNYTCVLELSVKHLKWWVEDDGSLTVGVSYGSTEDYDESFDLSNKNTTLRKIEYLIRRKLFKNNRIVFLSLANNDLESVPLEGLQLISDSLQYLSLARNLFSYPINSDEDNRKSWADFPNLLNLRELDLRDCGILYIPENAFKTMPNLNKLFLSRNLMTTVPSTAFKYVPNLTHLDLSYNDCSSDISVKTPNDVYMNLVGGLILPDNVFENLTKLQVLDLSHTKISVTSAKAISFLGPKLEQLSLCHTGIQVIAPRMFSQTSLRVLDISGNPTIAASMDYDIFDGLQNKLEILFFKYSNIKTLHFLKYLEVLTIISLRGNFINMLTNDTFQNNPKIEIMDLSSNHISNWYSRVLETNTNLKILNLRDNNINVITNDMMNDFLELQFLAIGNNNFICDCILRAFIDMASNNNCNVQCSVEQVETSDSSTALTVKHTSSRIYNSYFSNIVNSYHNLNKANPSVGFSEGTNDIVTYTDIVNTINQYKIPSALRESYVRITTKHVDVVCNRSQQIQNCEEIKETGEMEPKSANTFVFQLLDFNEYDYKCINSTTNKEYFLHDIEHCFEYRDWNTDESQPTGRLVINLIIISVVIFIFYLICYYKWWYIRYFLILFKNATILSFLDKEKELLDNQDNADIPFNYDVFVSYCDENRNWVLQQFLPNIEDDTEINVCLHERDFQVGLSILENIIYCMDRSRALLLIVSESFLLSHWCQFEMHLAQYRLLETRRENLIIVLLEDIPRRKRPKTLHYLMKIKTYIKWPSNKKNSLKLTEAEVDVGVPDKLLMDERKLFWKRLKKALRNSQSDSITNRKISVSHV